MNIGFGRLFVSRYGRGGVRSGIVYFGLLFFAHCALTGAGIVLSEAAKCTAASKQGEECFFHSVVV
jgi:hypothetical protein